MAETQHPPAFLHHRHLPEPITLPPLTMPQRGPRSDTRDAVYQLPPLPAIYSDPPRQPFQHQHPPPAQHPQPQAHAHAHHQAQHHQPQHDPYQPQQYQSQQHQSQPYQHQQYPPPQYPPPQYQPQQYGAPLSARTHSVSYSPPRPDPSFSPRAAPQAVSPRFEFESGPGPRRSTEHRFSYNKANPPQPPHPERPLAPLASPVESLPKQEPLQSPSYSTNYAPPAPAYGPTAPATRPVPISPRPRAYPDPPAGEPAPRPTRTVPQPRSVSRAIEVNGRELVYNLRVRQQPVAARACGFGERDRRVIDPPPIVQLTVTDTATGEPDMEEIGYSLSVVHTTLWNADASAEETRLDHPDRPSTRRLMGQLAASPSVARDEHDVEGCFFCFPDLSCRTHGRYRLRFVLMRVDPHELRPGGFSPFLAEVYSAVFTVFTAKDFPGMRASSALARTLKAQGCNIQVKKGNDKVAARKRFGYVDDADADADDDDVAKRRRRE